MSAYTIEDLKRGIEGMRNCSGFEPEIDTDKETGEIVLRTGFKFKSSSSEVLEHLFDEGENCEPGNDKQACYDAWLARRDAGYNEPEPEKP